jgi:hypothetical protein
MMKSSIPTLLLLVFLLLLCCHCHASGVIPTAELFVWNQEEGDFSLLVTQAHYGPLSEMNSFHSHQPETPPSHAISLVHSPDNNLLLCQNDTVLLNQDILRHTKNSLLLVPRGVCSFEFKTHVAQTLYQASGVAIYNTLAAQYRWNDTSSDILWPREYFDYDCGNAEAEFPSDILHFFDDASTHDQPYDGAINDPLLTGNTQDSLCKLHDKNHLEKCPSQRCLVAHRDDDSNTTTTPPTDTITVCCAWDLPIEPVGDMDLHRNISKITIPTVFLTMQQGAQLQQTLSSGTKIMLYSRWKPYYNPSSLLIWMLGVLVAALAAYGSAREYHTGIRQWLKKQRQSREMEARGQHEQQQRPVLQHQRSSSSQEETLELEPIHALFFVIMASTSLLVLFFFKVRVAMHCMSKQVLD